MINFILFMAGIGLAAIVLSFLVVSTPMFVFGFSAVIVAGFMGVVFDA